MLDPQQPERAVQIRPVRTEVSFEFPELPLP
jgi:hypothetical protein